MTTIIPRLRQHVVNIGLSTSVDTSEGAPEWVTVAAPDRTFNLLDLQNGSTTLLGEADVPPGNYQAVRVTIDPDRSSLTTTEGEKVVLQLDSRNPGGSIGSRRRRIRSSLPSWKRQWPSARTAKTS